MMSIPPVTPSDISILVVDDDAVVAQGTAHLLSLVGYTIAVASNGAEALQTMQTFRPDLVLSDWEMPELDGVELCRRIKADPAFANVFVILLSGIHTQSDKQVAGLESGADGYIARPISNRELTARIEAFVRILRLNRMLWEKNAELQAALDAVKQLSGLLPICASCKKIRDERGSWSPVDVYVQEHSEAVFTHGFCPDCIDRLYPEEGGDGSGPACPRDTRHP